MRNKYRAVPTTIDGIRFASKREGARYAELKLLEKAGEIRNLECHPVFPIVIDGVKIGRYTADFAYFTDNERVVEDVKSKATAKGEAYRLRIKVVRVLYPGVDFREVF